MFIQTEQTPNPATLKFLPGCTVMESGTANFPERGAAARPRRQVHLPGAQDRVLPARLHEGHGHALVVLSAAKDLSG